MKVYSLLNDEGKTKLKKVYDFVIIGSGVGGGLAAQELSKKNHSVLLIEMGPALFTKDFKIDESFSYQNMYQDAAGRKTARSAAFAR